MGIDTPGRSVRGLKYLVNRQDDELNREYKNLEKLITEEAGVIQHETYVVVKKTQTVATAIDENVKGGLVIAGRTEMNTKVAVKEIQELRAETAEGLVRMEQVLSGGREEQCLQSLYTTEYESDKDFNPIRVPGTCEWFLRHGSYRDWQEKDSSILWVSAGPACGKSVLSRFLVDKYKSTYQSDSYGICYFFFKDVDKARTNAANALCAIIHQLFKNRASLIKYAMAEFATKGPSFVAEFGTLWTIFTKAVADPDCGEVICVVDALDECEESSRLKLINELVELYSSSGGNATTNMKLKFIVTSRPYLKIVRRFNKLTSELPSTKLNGDNETKAISAEIDLVIKDKVQEIGLLEDDVQAFLTEHLMSIADRTYLWVDLIFPIIEESLEFTKPELLEVISTLPSTVNNAYEKILSQSPNVKEAKKLLQIVAAAIRPLTLTEMNVALAIREGNKSQEDLHLVPKDSLGTKVTNLCGLFVRVIDSKIYLVHQTAKEFLEALPQSLMEPSIDTISSPAVWKHSLDPVDSNLVLTKICIYYLLFDVFESRPLAVSPEGQIGEEVDRYTSQHGFLDYAAKHWTVHLRGAQIKAEPKLLDATLEVCDTRTKRFLTWFQVYWTTIDSYARCPQTFTDLMVGSYFGHEAVVGLLLEKGADVDAKNNYGWTALHWAAMKGYSTVVVALLLKEAIKVDVKDNDGRTALHQAASNGHSAAVRLLVENGAGIATKDNDGQTALHWTIRNKHETVMQQLLEEVDVATKDDDGGMALHWAAQCGHESAVQQLLEKGAGIDAKDNNGGTALHWAANYKHESVVRLLLEKGADVDATDLNGGTPLHQAVSCGHESMVRLLLEKGADVNTYRFGWTSLHHAAGNGRETVVQLLLKNGADVEAEGENGETALYQAASNGHEAVVRLLLQNGANINAKDMSGRTPLDQAVSHRYEAVVRLLLEKEADVGAKSEDVGQAQAEWTREAQYHDMAKNISSPDYNRTGPRSTSPFSPHPAQAPNSILQPPDSHTAQRIGSGGKSTTDAVIAVFGASMTGKSSFISRIAMKKIDYGLNACESYR
jgi:ankyrin repeat domain-containing protein 50